MDPRDGSAGQFLPDIEHKLQPVEGVSEMRNAADEPGAPASLPARLLPHPDAGRDAGAPGVRTHSDKADKRIAGTSENQSLLTSAATRSTNVGRLFVRGPNIMRGYVNPEVNAAFQALGGWYDTGDIVRVDDE